VKKDRDILALILVTFCAVFLGSMTLISLCIVNTEEWGSDRIAAIIISSLWAFSVVPSLSWTFHFGIRHSIHNYFVVHGYTVTAILIAPALCVAYYVDYFRK
jgi:hypothetical protein